MKNEITKAFISYYDEYKRDLPWRKTKDAYKIWISEIMLQQTRVEAVKGYYERFITTLPTLTSLAEVDDDTLMKLWQGLGYYSRARNLKKCAEICVNEYNGELPITYDELVNLPGIGKYTAGAITSIAYNQRKSAVDGNVMRVFARLFDIHDNILKEKTKEQFITLVDEYVDDERPGDFNQSIMDFANDLCIANGTPACEKCPLKDYCQAYQNNTVMMLPSREKKVSKKEELHTVIILRYRNEVYLQKRPKSGLLANMYEFTNFTTALNVEDIEKMFINVESLRYIGELKNVFSHLIWYISVYEVYVNDKPSLDGIWVKEKEIEEVISLPTVMSKIWELTKIRL